MPKDFDEYGLSKRNKTIRELAQQMGVNRDDFEEEDTGSQGAFDQKGYEQAISDAYHNNYDVRRSLEAANLSGSEDAPKHKGISNIKEAYETHKYLKGIHEDELKNGGKFSSNNDYGNVSRYLVNQDRDKLQQGFTDDLNAMKDKLLAQSKSDKEDDTSDEPVVHSERLANARAGADAPKTNIYDQNNSEAPDTSDAEQASQNFLTKNVLDVSDGLKLRPSASNMSNAQAALNIDGR